MEWALHFRVGKLGWFLGREIPSSSRWMLNSLHRPLRWSMIDQHLGWEDTDQRIGAPDCLLPIHVMQLWMHFRLGEWKVLVGTTDRAHGTLFQSIHIIRLILLLAYLICHFLSKCWAYFASAAAVFLLFTVDLCVHAFDLEWLALVTQLLKLGRSRRQIVQQRRLGRNLEVTLLGWLQIDHVIISSIVVLLVWLFCTRLVSMWMERLIYLLHRCL